MESITKGTKKIIFSEAGKKLANNYTSPFKFWLGMLYRLPTVIYWGVRLKNLDPEKCAVTIPYSWRTQNPFSSTYFAALAGAAELSTGALCQAHLAGRGKWSMLVTDLNVQYTKKATTKITFLCEQGEELVNTLDNIEKTGTPQKLTMVSAGPNTEGVEVAKVFVTWSFKK